MTYIVCLCNHTFDLFLKCKGYCSLCNNLLAKNGLFHSEQNTNHVFYFKMPLFIITQSVILGKEDKVESLIAQLLSGV